MKRGLGILELRGSRIVQEPINLTGGDRSHSRSWKTDIGFIQNGLEDVCFVSPTSYESDSRSVIDDGIGESDTLWGWFGRIGDVCDPSVFLGEQFVSGEERCCVSVGTHSQEDEIEYWESCGIAACEFSDKLLFVIVREVLEIICERVVDGVDLVLGNGNL